MVIREPKEILPTMKVNPKSDDDLAFKECQVQIIGTKDIRTKYGERIALILHETEKDFKFEVFLNERSLREIVSTFGKDDEAWKGKLVSLTSERDPKFNKEMIVVQPVK